MCVMLFKVSKHARYFAWHEFTTPVCNCNPLPAEVAVIQQTRHRFTLQRLPWTEHKSMANLTLQAKA